MKQIGIAVSSALALWAVAAHAQAPERPTVDVDGTSRGSAAVPLSQFLSPQGKAQLKDMITRAPAAGPSTGASIETTRKSGDERAKKTLDGWQAISPTTLEESSIDGVRIITLTPNAGIKPENKKRVLINVHGGGFFTGGMYGGQIESLPLAARGGIKVVAIDYRMAPENVFPAASEDVEKVYRHLLKSYKPQNIGIFGCSAGGTLVGQSLAWFQDKKLPRPGAAGIFCSGLLDTFWYGGDLGAVNGLMNASAPSRPPSETGNRPFRPYVEGTEKNPLIVPGNYPEVLAKFPPTLFVTGTRDVAASNAIVTHAKMVGLGVDAQLYMTEGLGHGHFYMMPGAPENVATYDAIWRFFDRHLGR